MKQVEVNKHKLTFYDTKDVPIQDDTASILYNGALKELPLDIASKVAERVWWEGVDYNLYKDHHSPNGTSAYTNPVKSLITGTHYTHILIQE